MTICIGIKFFNGVGIIADSRVEWPQNHSHADVLQKIYGLGKDSAIAFAGNVYTAGKLLQFLGTQISYEAKILVLKPKISRWLKFGWDRLKENRPIGDVSFLAVGIHSDRSSLEKIHSPAGYIIRYDSPNFKPVPLSGTQLITIDVIGSGRTIKNELEEEFNETINFSPFNIGNHLLVFMSQVKSILNNKPILNVGGLLQLGFFDGMHSVSMGYNIETQQAGRTIEHYGLVFENGRYFQIDHQTGKKIKLKFAWEGLDNTEGIFNY